MAFDPEDPDRRREGIALLSKRDWGLREPHLKGYAALLEADDDPSVRSVAARALGKAGDTKYLSDVIKALSDKSPSVRWDAAAALDKLTGESAIDPLRQYALEDSSVDVRTSCARALRHYRRTLVVQTLTECLLDENFGVRYQAHTSLVEIAGRDLGYYPESWKGVSAVAALRTDEKKRPWWDWFGTSRGKKNVSDKSGNSIIPGRNKPSSNTNELRVE